MAYDKYNLTFVRGKLTFVLGKPRILSLFARLAFVLKVHFDRMLKVAS